MVVVDGPRPDDAGQQLGHHRPVERQPVMLELDCQQSGQGLCVCSQQPQCRLPWIPARIVELEHATLLHGVGSHDVQRPTGLYVSVEQSRLGRNRGRLRRLRQVAGPSPDRRRVVARAAGQQSMNRGEVPARRWAQALAKQRNDIPSGPPNPTLAVLGRI